MLVLTRRQGESIIIGNGVKLTVVSVGPGRVKIGIDAPANVRIDREEIHARIQQEHEQAADVLAAVSSDALVNSGEHNTIVDSGSATRILHNRIGGQLPSSPPATAPVPDNPKISDYRRKPR